MPIEAAIFDMDGTLIDSEPFWKKAEKEIFSALGVPYTAALAEKTHALPARDVTLYWYDIFPWETCDFDQVESKVFEHVRGQIRQEGKAKPGAYEALQFFYDNQIPIGLATNSPKILIEGVLDKLDIGHFFNILCSSEDEVHGKPSPDVYLTACKMLKVNPSNCIAFEDSITGITSAHAAKMKTVYVPEYEYSLHRQHSKADLILGSLNEFSGESLNLLFANA